MAILSHVAGKSVYLDTNVFIYAIEGFSPFADELDELFASFDGIASASVSRIAPKRGPVSK